MTNRDLLEDPLREAVYEACTPGQLRRQANSGHQPQSAVWAVMQGHTRLVNHPVAEATFWATWLSHPERTAAERDER